MGKKQKLLAQEQADQMPLTRAQVLMRADILGGASTPIKQSFTQPPLFDDELDDETPEQHEDWKVGQTRNADPVKLGSVLDEAFGGHVMGSRQMDRDQEISALAMEVITDGPRLELSLDQWQRVQLLVEAAVRAGSDAEQSGRL